MMSTGNAIDLEYGEAGIHKGAALCTFSEELLRCLRAHEADFPQLLQYGLEYSLLLCHFDNYNVLYKLT
jgi:hypothetical protein